LYYTKLLLFVNKNLTFFGKKLATKAGIRLKAQDSRHKTQEIKTTIKGGFHGFIVRKGHEMHKKMAKKVLYST